TPVDEARRFMVDCFKAAGTPDDHAQIVADNLVEADYRGHYSHGMNRLEMYIRDIQGGMCDAKAKCCIDKENVATAVVDGKNGLGAVVGKFCMDLAIEKAKKCCSDEENDGDHLLQVLKNEYNATTERSKVMKILTIFKDWSFRKIQRHFPSATCNMIKIAKEVANEKGILSDTTPKSHPSLQKKL
ncbi:hypothetical protein NQ314_009568, partial [Rhamnusium bicolor]